MRDGWRFNLAFGYQYTASSFWCAVRAGSWKSVAGSLIMKNTRDKIKHWIKRYGPQELLWTLGAVIFGYIAFRLSWNEIIGSFVGTRGENMWYYGYAIWQEAKEQAKLGKRGWKKLLGIAQDIVTEFWFSELLDSFLIRPGCMYFASQRLGSFGRGLLLGKIMADVVFYIPTTYFYQKTLNRDINTFLDKIEDKLKQL